MKARRTAAIAALACLVGTVLACNLPASSPSPTLSPTESPVPGVPPSEGTPSPEATPTAAMIATPEPTAESGPLVAYTKSGTIWIVEGGGGPRQLTSGGTDGSPQFSPDGRQVVFRRDVPSGEAGLSQTGLWVVRVDGTGERRLVAAEDLLGEAGTSTDADPNVPLERVLYQVAWLPSGGSVAFNTRVLIEHGLTIKDDLWLAEIESGQLTRLLSDGEGGVFAFSPDGTRLVVTTPRSVSMMKADGTDRRTLVTFEPVNTASEYAYYPMPVWAPDGSHALVAISSSEPFRLDVPTADIWRLPSSGDAVRLATLRGHFLFISTDGSMWSADRTRIGYTVSVGDGASSERQLIVANVDGSGDTIYATGEIEFLGWADEGARFAFRTAQSGEVTVGEIGEPSNLLVPTGETERIVSIDWSGPGTIVYSMAQEDAFQIWVKRWDDAPSAIDTAIGTLPNMTVYP